MQGSQQTNRPTSGKRASDRYVIHSEYVHSANIFMSVRGASESGSHTRSSKAISKSRKVDEVLDHPMCIP